MTSRRTFSGFEGKEKDILSKTLSSIIRLKHITKEYKNKHNVQLILDNISYSFENGLVTSVLGCSGCGKTTLLNLIGGIDPNFEGEILFKDQLITDFDKYRRENISFIFQDFNLISHHNLIKNITVGMTNEVQDKEQKALNLLKQVGLLEHAHKKTYQLSGGERQRIAITRALARDTDLLLCDEPTGSLDDETKEEIMQLIVEVFKGKTIIFITHDKELAEKFSDVVLKIEDKKLIEVYKNDRSEEINHNINTKKQEADKTFSRRFEINLLSKKLTLLNSAYLIMVISAIFLFGTGIVKGIELKIDNYLYDKYKVDKIDVFTTDYTLSGFGVLTNDINEANANKTIGYMTGTWMKTHFVTIDEESYNFCNTLQVMLKDKFEPDIIYGRFPQKNDEILYSKRAAQKKIFNYHNSSIESEIDRNTLFDRLINMSDEEIFNDLNAIDISYKNLCKYTDEKAYDPHFVIVGLIDDSNYTASDIPFNGNAAHMRKYNIHLNTELSVKYKGEVKTLVVNDNIYMLEEEFSNYIDAVYIGKGGLKFNAFSVFIEDEDLDLRNKVYDSLLLYKYMVSGGDFITDEREAYYEEVHGYKIAIIGACVFLLVFAVIAIYNGIKTGIERNKMNIGIYKSLGYTSGDIKSMFFKEGLLIAMTIIVATFIIWFILTMVLGDYIVNTMDLSGVIDVSHIVYLETYSAIGSVALVFFIILGAISIELRKINIMNLIKNRVR